MIALSARRIDPANVTKRELEAIDEIVQRAYRMPSRIERIKRFLLVEGGVWAVAETDGALVSVGGAIAYPDGGFGWIGLIGTDPTMVGRGGGRVVTQFLVDELASRGCRSALDASEAGAPLYRAMAFTDHGRVTKLHAPVGSWSSSPTSISDGGSVSLNTVSSNGGVLLGDSSGMPSERSAVNASDGGVKAGSRSAATFAIHLFNDEHLPELLRYDKAIFGANRFDLLRYMVDRSPNRCFAARSVDDGRIVGYVFAQADCIGPLCADQPEVSDALLGAALACRWDRSPEIVVPNANGYVSRFLTAGWTLDRTLYHQRLELDQLPGDRSRLVAQVSFGEG
jgi:GNAT superfamily N-acetyltransferase